MSIALLAVTALPFVVSPGASFNITIGAAVDGDRRAPFKVWAGSALGIVLIASVTGFSGLGQLIASSSMARAVFGIVGGLVLIAIGASSLVKAFRATAAPDSKPRASSRLILWSFLAIITNVKALSLYALVVPGLHVIGMDGPTLSLTFAVVHIALLLIWLLMLGALVRAVPILGKSGRARTILLVLAASTIILLGTLSLIGALF